MDELNRLTGGHATLGKVYSPGGKLRIIFHPSFIWYFDGEHSITIARILFPDGTIWYTFAYA